jgi:hypothetical protein
MSLITQQSLARSKQPSQIVHECICTCHGWREDVPTSAHACMPNLHTSTGRLTARRLIVKLVPIRFFTCAQINPDFAHRLCYEAAASPAFTAPGWSHHVLQRTYIRQPL